MKWRKWMLTSAVALLVLSGCEPTKLGDTKATEQQSSNAKEVETTHIPNMQLSDSYYRTLIPYKESATRGLVVSNLNTKYDIKEVEEGLMRLSQNVFSTKDYYFQEGQYLSKSTVQNWLARPNQTKDEKPENQGLNPSSVDANGQALEPDVRAEKAPIYLSHIVEQNYLKKTGENKVSLGGVSIGLALNSIYYYQREQYGEFYERQIEDAELLKEGEKIAQEVIRRMRMRPELENVPIVIGLYKQEAKNSILPGSYMQYAVAEAGKSSLGDWVKLNEKYVSFPMSSPPDIYRDINKAFLDFKLEIDEYFSNQTSIIGTGFYQNDEIRKISIEIPIQFFGKAEIIGFTQYLTGVMLTELPLDVPITISITSLNGAEAIIHKEADQDEPFVHIYD